MKNPLKRNPIAAAETELANLAARRETLENRRTAAVAMLEAARSTRKSALANDPDVDLAGFTRSVRDGEEEVETLTGVLSDLSEQVADAERRLADAKDSDVRTATAKELDVIASTFDTAAAELDAAFSALGKAAARMVGALPETLKVVEFDRSGPTGQSERERLVAAIIAEGLAASVPSAMPTQFWGETGYNGHNAILRRYFDLRSERITSYTNNDPTPLRARDAAAAVVTDRLRERARRIVAGDMSSNLEDAPIFQPEPAPVSSPLVEIYAMKNFAFQLEEGRLHDLVRERWAHNIPEDAATVAVAAGVALRTNTEEGAKAFHTEKDRRAKSPNGAWGGSYLDRSMCHDLGLIRKLAPDVDADNVVSLHNGAEAA